MYDNIEIINIDDDIIFPYDKKEKKKNYELGLLHFFKLFERILYSTNQNEILT